MKHAKTDKGAGILNNKYSKNIKPYRFCTMPSGLPIRNTLHGKHSCLTCPNRI